MRRLFPSGFTAITFLAFFCLYASVTTHAQSLPRDSQVILSDPFELTQPVYGPAPNTQQNPDVVFDGNRFFVIWADDRESLYTYSVYGTRVSLEGRILDPGAIAIADTDTYKPALGWDGQNYFVVWSHYMDEPHEILGRFVDTNGNLIGDDPVSIQSGAGWRVQPVASFDGSNYLVAWLDNRNLGDYDYRYDVYASRVTTAGAALDPAGIPVAINELKCDDLRISYGGGVYLLAWNEYEVSDSDYTTNFVTLNVARVSPEGQILDPDSIVIAANDEIEGSDFDVTFDGGNFWLATDGVIVSDGDKCTDHICAKRISPVGTIVDDDWIQLTSNAAGQSSPVMECDSQQCIVVYRDCRYFSEDVNGCSLFTTRFLPDTTVINPDGTHLENTQHYNTPTNPTVAYGDDLSLVSWEYDPILYEDIRGIRIDQNGEELDEDGFDVSTAAAGQFIPAAAYGSGEFMAVWSDEVNYWSSMDRTDIHGNMVSEAGQVANPDGIEIGSGYWFQDDPDIATDGTDFLAVWRHDHDIEGIRIAPDGSMIDAGNILIADTYNNNVLYPAVAYGVGEYLVVFNKTTGVHLGLYAVRVAADGQVIDDENWLTLSEDDNSRFPDVAYCGSNFLVTWSMYSGTQIKAARVTPAGEVLDPEGFLIKDGSTDVGFSTVACNGSEALVIFSDQRNHPTTWGYDLFGRFVDADLGTLTGDDFDVSTVDQWQINPTLAFNGTNYIALWRDYRHSPDTQVYGARITPQGQVLDPDGFMFSPYVGKNQIPNITCNTDGLCMGIYSIWAPERGYNNYRVMARLIEESPATTTTTTTYTTTTTIPADDDVDDDVDDDDVNDDANDDIADDDVNDDAINDDLANDDADDDTQNGGSDDDDDDSGGGKCMG